jgi:polyisoprenoid-binding protein YceI
MKLQLVAFAAALFALPVLAQETYILDPTHSQPGWEARHVGFTLQRGSFGKATGKIVLDRAAKKGTVDIVIDATSIKSFDARLDAVLKGDKFFNVEKFPTLEFKSTDVVFDGDRVVRIDGHLTMIGVTKPVSLRVADFKCGDQPFNKKPMCGADASGTIKRSEWGMTNGISANITNPSDDVGLTIPVEAYKE